MKDYKKEKMLYNATRKMNYKQLDGFAKNIRKYIYNIVSKGNGHLASNLGVVELTLAMYRTFNPEEDVIIWDTSHQAYVHKLLTGRWGAFKTLRKLNGISGFTNINESRTDRFIAGHAATSIAAGIGYALGDKVLEKSRSIVTVIGDGAFTSGMALESLNQLKYQKTNIKIILNSNDMAISNNVGTLSTLFSKIRVKKSYNTIKKYIKESLNDSEIGQDLELILKKLRNGMKYSIYSEPAGFFEDMGIKYYGPVDGHNIKELELFMKCLKNYNNGPAVLQVLTTKGKGIEKAEKNPSKFHGMSIKKEGLSYSKIVGKTLSILKDYRYLAFTAAMTSGTGLDELKKEAPEKMIDMGITEPSIVTTAAALSLTGILPIVDIYSTFLQRAYDSLIHDVSLQSLPVLFLLDRAGLVGEDGPTHHGIFDIAYLRPIPNIEVLTPLDGFDLANMIYTSIVKEINKPRFIRFPKEYYLGKEEDLFKSLKEVNYNWKYLKKSNSNIYALAVGTLSKTVYKALKDYEVNIIGVRSIKPIDNNIMNEINKNASIVITYEEGILQGGFNEEIKNKKVYAYGIKDFVTHGTREELLKICELDLVSIKTNFEKILERVNLS
ncbi:1-deoxy-D-xylulose-5-phosphate synthase [Tepiditoga spiralis]|uniref:1-deoxy-D-xylulose-5-phosphate synthase n=1 Tax=Tepiditoga spiralis TaxID=2108365 RepID=A0A7G1GA05_9BACT|nr:1-deoxy-D-xylulose-5-phosphate synthase [Tepiditoga spiralis]BBE31857.1 1-deoxy-D-xylulose-5-phosphate synthase [Tepiditoga spiralis]